MTASEEPARAAVDTEAPEPGEDEGVPNGEEEIDDLGRNATQRRMAELGEPPVE
ncbi:MAG TPA: hypothetical protein VFO81_00540 [Gaiellaceae bacterium]|nr:hypothetical protein [Gaiellaceae bacterium]